jgi:hypothetical protein
MKEMPTKKELQQIKNNISRREKKLIRSAKRKRSNEQIIKQVEEAHK